MHFLWNAENHRIIANLSRIRELMMLEQKYINTSGVFQVKNKWNFAKNWNWMQSIYSWIFPLLCHLIEITWNVWSEKSSANALSPRPLDVWWSSCCFGLIYPDIPPKPAVCLWMRKHIFSVRAFCFNKKMISQFEAKWINWILWNMAIFVHNHEWARNNTQITSTMTRQQQQQQ